MGPSSEEPPSPNGRFTGWLQTDSNPAGVVYGIITVGALLAAESDRHRESYPEAIASLAIAIVLYWVAHAYADALGHRLSTQSRLEMHRLWTAFLHDCSIVRGATVPLLGLVVAWAVGAGEDTGVVVAMWTAIAALIAVEVIAGIRSHARSSELVLDAAVGMTLGVAILALKIVLH